MTDQSPGADDIEAVARAMYELRPVGTRHWPDCPTREASGLREQARAAITALDHLRTGSGGGWLPIETAPKDGTRVLLWVAWRNGARTEIGYWQIIHWVAHTEGGEKFPSNVLKWQPLPLSHKAPATPSTEEQPERSEDET